MVLPDPPPWILVYVPLLLVEITTLLLLLRRRLSPMVRLTRATFFCFALMLGVWAVWALAGFGYPSAALPIALNIASKILAFAAALTLFLPRQPAPGQAPQPENNEQADPPAERRRAPLPTLPADMTPPPDSGGQINSFGMPPLVDTGRLDTDHLEYFAQVRMDSLAGRSCPNGKTRSSSGPTRTRPPACASCRSPTPRRSRTACTSTSPAAPRTATGKSAASATPSGG